eukprot:1864807-Amphidinium_carterae.1
MRREFLVNRHSDFNPCSLFTRWIHICAVTRVQDFHPPSAPCIIAGMLIVNHPACISSCKERVGEIRSWIRHHFTLKELERSGIFTIKVYLVHCMQVLVTSFDPCSLFTRWIHICAVTRVPDFHPPSAPCIIAVMLIVNHPACISPYKERVGEIRHLSLRSWGDQASLHSQGVGEIRHHFTQKLERSGIDLHY